MTTRARAVNVAAALITMGTTALAQDVFTVKATLLRVPMVQEEDGTYREPGYTFSSEVLTVSRIPDTQTGDSDVREETMPAMAFNSATIAIGEDTVQLMDDGMHVEKHEDSNLAIVAQPSITTLAEEPATISIGGTAPQYFSRNADGTYSLQTLEESLGFSLSVTTRPAGESDPVSVNYALDLAYVAGREAIEGTSLDIGKPRIGHIQKEGSWSATTSQWVMVGTPTNGPEMYMCFFQVKRSSGK